MTEERIGILFAGEMGTAIGSLLSSQGHEVLTTLGGRSEATRNRCTNAGFTVVDTIGEVADRATMIWSLTHPGSAGEIAERFVGALPADVSEKHYIDANSISPRAAEEMARLLERHGVRFVDAAIQGPAAQLRERSILYLSGEGADRVEDSLRGSMRVRRLGTEAGAASRFKMTMAGISKGLPALFMEIASVARHQELLGAWIADCRHFYPGVIGAVEKLLPSYALHSRRRAAELGEVEETVRDLGLQPGMIVGARGLIDRLAAHHEDEAMQRCAEATPSLEEFLDLIASFDLLGHESCDSSAGQSSIPRTNPRVREETDHG